MFVEKQPAVYIVASRYRGTIYTGVTSNLYDRIHAHKQQLFQGFSSDYDCHKLVWYENHPTMPEAIRRETQITASLDKDVLAWLKADGRGYQTRMNAILRREMLQARAAGSRK